MGRLTSYVRSADVEPHSPDFSKKRESKHPRVEASRSLVSRVGFGCWTWYRCANQICAPK